jgi:hypothetical protein
MGFLCKEMNAGWGEWLEAQLPTHAGAPGEDGKCVECV